MNLADSIQKVPIILCISTRRFDLLQTYSFIVKALLHLDITCLHKTMCSFVYTNLFVIASVVNIMFLLSALAGEKNSPSYYGTEHDKEGLRHLQFDTADTKSAVSNCNRDKATGKKSSYEYIIMTELVLL
jgi:hypothetical protein